VGHRTTRYGQFVVEGALNEDRSVFRARDATTGALTVVKIPRRSAWSALTRRDPRENARVFAYEAAMLEAWRGISGVVQLLDRGIEGRTPFVAIEWLGQTLEDATPAEGLDLAASLQVVRDVAETLDQIHGRGDAHYDIKPENALWSERARRWTLIDPAPAELSTDAYFHPHLHGAPRDLCALARTFVTTYTGSEETVLDDAYAEVLEESDVGTRFLRALRRCLRDGRGSARALGRSAAALLADVTA